LSTDKDRQNKSDLKPAAPFGKVKLTIEYDGTNYVGWQRQGPGQRSIQEAIENVLVQLFGRKVDLIGAGRTDSGVHATNQVAHFVAPRDISTFKFLHLFPTYLPADISVKRAELLPAEFHAQRSALAKTYIYKIWNGPVPSALRNRRALWVRRPLNLERLNLASQFLIGTHDFNCFRSEGSAVKTTQRTVNWARWVEVDDFIEFQINGTGFLKQMVRNIVGTLLQIEFGQRDPESIPTLIAGRDRTKAGPTVGPQGLYLERVFYPPHLDNLAQPL